jgi:hypothetical protein
MANSPASIKSFTSQSEQAFNLGVQVCLSVDVEWCSHMLRPDPKADNPGGGAAKKRESYHQPDGIGRYQRSLAIQHLSDHAVLDDQLDSLSNCGRPGTAGLHLG